MSAFEEALDSDYASDGQHDEDNYYHDYEDENAEYANERREERERERQIKLEIRETYKQWHRIRDTGLPIVVEDCLGLATRIRLATLRDWRQRSSRTTSGIVIHSNDGLRPLLPTSIPRAEVRRWVSGFMDNAEVMASLGRDRFDVWQFVRRSDGPIAGLIGHEDDAVTAGWGHFGDSNESLRRMGLDEYAVFDPLPGHPTYSDSSVCVGVDVEAGAYIGDDSIRMLGYRAGAPKLSDESIAATREVLNRFVVEVTRQAMESARASSIRSRKPNCILSRDLDGALRSMNVAVAGYGHRGLQDCFNTDISALLSQIHPLLGMDICALRVLNDIAVSFIDELLLACGCSGQLSYSLTSQILDKGIRRLMYGELMMHAFRESNKALVKLASDADTTKPLSQRAGTVFNADVVKSISQQLRNVNFDDMAAVRVAAIIEYVTAEILELSGNAARDNMSRVMIPRHIYLAIVNDLELRATFLRLTIADGGRIPHIHRSFVGGAHNGRVDVDFIRTMRRVQSQTTPCVSSNEFDRFVVAHIRTVDPCGNISQEALNKIQCGTEEYVLNVLSNAHLVLLDERQRAGEDEPMFLPRHIHAADRQIRFFAACCAGSSEDVRQLIADGGNVNQATLNHLPLYYAARAGHLSVMEMLLEDHRADQASISEATLCAAEVGDSIAMQTLLNFDNDNVNAVNINNRSALQVACKFSEYECCVEVAELLLLRGATPGHGGRDEIAGIQVEEVRDRLLAARESYLNPGLK